MFKGLKRWLGRSTVAADPDWDDVLAWADTRHFVFRAVAQEGFVVEGQSGGLDWRLEWGPSRRPYIPGNELRVQTEIAQPADLQAVLMNRRLQEALEKAMFEQYVEDVQTRIDHDIPPEARWLVVYPKLELPDVPGLRDRWSVVGSNRAWLRAWLEGPLLQALSANTLPPEQVQVMTLSRRRLLYRVACPEPALSAIQPALRLFETALREAQRVEASEVEPSHTPTSPSLWGQGEDSGPHTR